MWNQSPRMVSGVHLYFRECRLAQRRYCPAALNKLPVWKGSRPGLRKVQVISFLLSCPGSLPQRSALRFEFPSSYQKNKRKKKVEEGRRQLLEHLVCDFSSSFLLCLVSQHQMLSASHCSAHTIRFGIWLGGSMWEGEGHRESFVHLLLSDSLKKI